MAMTDDWAMVPDSYAIGMDQLEDTLAPGGHGTDRDPKDLDVKVKVGWVKGLNRLYFLYEAYDNYWDFSRPDLHNDIFEVVVDGDLSGGPLIDIYHRDVWTKEAFGEMADLDPRISSSDAYFSYQGDQAQNYHIFTPAEGKGLGNGLGMRSVHKGAALRESCNQIQLQARRVGKTGAGVLDYSVRLRRVRRSGARRGDSVDGKQIDRTLVGGPRLR
jgi:hypothetical protein